jgi:hypothetical protein
LSFFRPFSNFNYGFQSIFYFRQQDYFYLSHFPDGSGKTQSACGGNYVSDKMSLFLNRQVQHKNKSRLPFISLNQSMPGFQSEIRIPKSVIKFALPYAA